MALLLAGCASSAGDAPEHKAAGGPRTFAASGSLSLSDPDGVYVATDAMAPGAPCQGSGGYDDLRPGAQVVVTDDAGKVLAVGRLDAGATDDSKAYTSPYYRHCVLPFTVSKVPAGEDFYGVQITHRGVVQKSEAEMRDPVALTFAIG